MAPRNYLEVVGSIPTGDNFDSECIIKLSVLVTQEVNCRLSAVDQRARLRHSFFVPFDNCYYYSPFSLGQRGISFFHLTVTLRQLLFQLLQSLNIHTLRQLLVLVCR